MLLQGCEFTCLAVLVDECAPVQIFLQIDVFFHIRKPEVLHFILFLLPAYQFLRRTDLKPVPFRYGFRYRKFSPPENEIVDACSLVCDFVKQTGCVWFEFETVGGLHQCHFLAWY